MDYEKYFTIIPIFILSLLLSIVVGVRPEYIGTDTKNYIAIFNSIGNGHYGRYEIGFVLLVKTIHSVFNSYIAFFSFVFFICFWLSYISFLLLNNFKNSVDMLVGSAIFCTIIFLSDWFYVGVTNAIRHAIAVYILILGVTLLFKRKSILLFLSICFISGLFHKTSFLIIPFFTLLYFKRNRLILITILLSFTYYLGINELIIKTISAALSSSLYWEIKNYAMGRIGLPPPWIGFDWRFVLYNLFWIIIFNIILLLKGYKKESYCLLNYLLKVYCILTIFYFVFGFGAFSNRWAYPSWLFLAIVQSTFLMKLNIPVKLKVLSTPLPILGMIFFISRFEIL